VVTSDRDPDATGDEHDSDEEHDPEALDRLFKDLHRSLGSSSDGLWPGGLSSVSGQSFRQLLLNALQDLGSPTSSLTLRPFIAARYGRTIPSTQFGTIASQERRAFDRGASTKPVWLASGLLYDSFRPVRRIFARSDWPLESRILGPASMRLFRLLATERLAELARNADREAQNADMLRTLALAHARELPGVRIDDESPDFAQIASVARDLVSKYQIDHLMRRAVAASLAELPERVQLFGVEDDTRRKRSEK
jgi:hypothetical protein